MLPFGETDFLLALFPPAHLLYHPAWLKYKVRCFQKMNLWEEIIDVFAWWFVSQWTPEQMEPL